MTLSPRFRIVSDADESTSIDVDDIDGLFRDRRTALEHLENPDVTPSYLLDLPLVRPRWRVSVIERAETSLPDDMPIGDARIEVLDMDSCSMGYYSIWSSQLVRESVGQNSWRFRGKMQSLPHAAASGVWERWRAGKPVKKGMWGDIPVGLREGWVEVARVSCDWSTPSLDVPVVLEGEHIDDLASFFCAVGEAFRGPGGYFGSTFYGFFDCLRASHVPMSTPLVWRNSEVARATLSNRLRGIENGDPQTPLEMILSTLADCGVEVQLT